jgi:hypothetical protein
MTGGWDALMGIVPLSIRAQYTWTLSASWPAHVQYRHEGGAGAACLQGATTLTAWQVWGGPYGLLLLLLL